MTMVPRHTHRSPHLTSSSRHSEREPQCRWHGACVTTAVAVRSVWRRVAELSFVSDAMAMKQFNALHLAKLFCSEEFHPPVWQPSLDVYRTRRGWLLKFELAGVSLDDVRLEVQDRTVRLTGSRRD